MTNSSIEAELFSRREALRQNPLVVKIGGSTAADNATTFNSLSFLHKEIGMPLVLVHGGGPEIDASLKKSGIETPRIEGLRVTDGSTLSVVVSVLDDINAQMVHDLGRVRVKTHPYPSTSKLLEAVIEDSRLGFVGSVSYVQTENLYWCIRKGLVPVISPIAVMKGNKAQHLNINGDTAAGAVAVALGADLILATDVEGVKDAGNNVISVIDDTKYEQLHADGVISRGMVPKMEAGLKVANIGRRAVICLARDLLHAFGDKPSGTLIV